MILVRHSCPEIVPSLPANQWSLSEQGRRRCKPLADKLADYGPDVFVTSTEPKAIETGQIAADLLGKPCETAQGLHEHERRNVGFGSKESFETAIAEFFAQPGHLVYGDETADQAHQRFVGAVAGVLERYLDQTVAIVSHGTVMTLLIARAAGLEPFAFWKRLGLPAFVVLSLPDLGLLNVVEDVQTVRVGRVEPVPGDESPERRWGLLGGSLCRYDLACPIRRAFKLAFFQWTFYPSYKKAFGRNDLFSAFFLQPVRDRLGGIAK